VRNLTGFSMPMDSQTGTETKSPRALGVNADLTVLPDEKGEQCHTGVEYC
jgi:hypothetical protein